MTHPMTTVLIVGASGSIGRHVVAQALEAGFETRALVRDAGQVSLFPEKARIVVGDPERAETLADALEGVTGIVFVQGTYSDAAAEQANYSPIVTVLEALKFPARIALMTAIGVTKPTPGHDWKRRGERLVRASGLPYTIVRPGWFDHNTADEQRLVMMQGDTRWAGDPSDGPVSRAQIAQTLISSLTSAAANRKTLELVAEHGPAQTDLEPLFAELQADPMDALDAVLDRDNLPLAQEPAEVITELHTVRERRPD